MKRTLITVLSCLALVTMFYLPNLQATEAPADMTIKPIEGMKATKSPVAFSHKAHAATDCKVCHHKWDGSGEVKGCAAEGCHTDAVDKKGEHSFYRAFHDMKSPNSCLGCHKANKGKAGPTKCNDCHPK